MINQKSEIILSIDPGLKSTGWAVFKNIEYLASGSIQPPKNITSLSLRLAYIATEIDAHLTKYSPYLVVIEKIFVNNNPISSLNLGYARGVVLTYSGLHGIPFIEISPNEVKKSITGLGHATKDQIYYMIKQLVPTADPKNQDETDAIAIGYTICSNISHYCSQ